MERINYLIAISLMDEKGEYLAKLFEIADYRQGSAFEQTMFSLAAKMLGFEPALSDLYQEENVAPTGGLQQLLEEAKQLQPFFEHTVMLSGYYVQEKYQEIWEWSRELLVECDINGQLSYLKQAIIAYELDAVNKTNTFAGLYFTYQILRTRFFT